MKYKIDINKKVRKFLQKNHNIARIFYRNIETMSTSPFYNFLDIKKLKGEENRYRLRIGKYRFLYEIVEDKILIFFYDAGSRGDVYKGN